MNNFTLLKKKSIWMVLLCLTFMLTGCPASDEDPTPEHVTKPFVTKWKVSAGDLVVFEKNESYYDVKVDWGDGIIDYSLHHTYAKSGEYIVKVSGSFASLMIHSDKLISEWQV